jgi:hypothetical protein
VDILKPSQIAMQDPFLADQLYHCSHTTSTLNELSRLGGNSDAYQTCLPDPS